MLRRSAVLVVLAALAAAPAHAQDRPLGDALSVTAGDACLDRAALLDAARAWLGRDHVDPRENVVVDVDPAGAVRIVALLDGHEAGVRVFDALPAACPDRRAVVALAVALAIDALLLDARSHTRPTLTPTRPGLRREGSPTLRQSAETTAENRRRPSLFVDVSGEGGVAAGMLPEVAAVGGASLALRAFDALSIRLGALGTSTAGVEVGTGRADVAVVAARFDLCLLAPARPFELAGCVGAAPGLALAQGHGYATDLAATPFYLALLARLEAAWWPTEVLGLTLAADLALPVARPRLEVLGPEGMLAQATSFAPLGVAVTAGLRFRFAIF